jgi:hypothetical protein
MQMDDPHSNLEFIAAVLKLRIPNGSAKTTNEKMQLFCKANGYFNISINPTQENLYPD